MNYSTKQKIKQLLGVRLTLLVVVSCVGLALLGQVPESRGGWLACPPTVVSLSQVSGEKKRARPPQKRSGGSRWGWLRQSWRVPAGRSLLIGLLWLESGQPGPVWLVGLPWLIWLGRGSGWVWPGLGRQPEWRIYAVHPGMTDTGIFPGFVKPLIRNLKTPEEGAETVVWCATSDEVGDRSGLYYSRKRTREPSDVALDDELAAELWRRSLEWCGLASP